MQEYLSVDLSIAPKIMYIYHHIGVGVLLLALVLLIAYHDAQTKHRTASHLMLRKKEHAFSENRVFCRPGANVALIITGLSYMSSNDSHIDSRSLASYPDYQCCANNTIKQLAQ